MKKSNVTDETKYYSAMRRLILSAMIGLPLGLLISVLCITYYFFTYSIEASTTSSMSRIVEDHRHMIDTFLRERKADLLFVLRSYTFKDLSNPQKLEQVFARLQEKSNAFVDLGIFNEAGVHVAYHGPYRLAGKIYKHAKWFKEVMKRGYYISDIFLGFRRVPHFIIAIAKEEKGRRWVIRATIDTYLFSNLVEGIRIGKTGEAYLLNAQGAFQTERRSGGHILEKDPETLQFPARGGRIKTFVQKDARGEKYLYATTWLKTLSTATYLVLLVSLVGGVAIISLAFSLTARIVGRMKQADMDKRSLSEQLIRASRLAELGEMAAGFAHEINNPLQIIRSEQTLIETILSDLKDSGQIKESKDLVELEESLDQIRLQIDRCARITQSILQFGRQSEPSFEEIDLRAWIPQVTAMVSKKASVHGIKLGHEISDHIPRVNGDPAQLQQVLINLLNNAMDAVLSRHGTEGGEITVGAAKKDKGKIVIWVRDNGIGISPENLKHIFRPFFTTKPPGKGTGLGLSVCYGIIENMGGTIEVESEKGIGTTFIITLPAEG
ncbi:MAG: two-component sensor histidine kinase [Desulfobacteraceae bacterium 4484_190.3]|nr:MAG: two-component sensor histidine kinase [Desulfobacteraceae bacterium 4484_190.3]